MSQRRLVAVLLFLFTIAFVVVHLEGIKVRLAREICGLNGRIVQLSYERWESRARLAELCSPGQLQARSERMALGTVAPATLIRLEAVGGEVLAESEVFWPGPE